MAYTFTWGEPLDPDEDKRYTIDWGEYLGTGETIATSAWVSVTAGAITIASDTNTTTTTSARFALGTGTLNSNYEMENTITTSDSNTMQITGLVKVRAR